MLKSPKEKKPNRAGLRVILEALAQAHPVTGALARMFNYARPTDLEIAIVAWRQEATDIVNDHEVRISSLEAILSPRLEISDEAISLAVWLTQSSIDGLKTLVPFTEIQEALPETPKKLLEEHCSELQHLGLLSISSALGYPITHVRLDYELYWTFDAAVMETNPYADAVHLAKLMLENEKFESVSELHKETGWEKRRLNPAVAMLMPHIAKGRTRQSLQPDYPTLGFSLASEDKFRLKKFIAEFEARRV